MFPSSTSQRVRFFSSFCVLFSIPPSPFFRCAVVAKIVDGFIYARGAMDDKMSVFAIMEALEALIDGGSFAPRRTILLAFGHDEEIMGTVRG